MRYPLCAKGSRQNNMTIWPERFWVAARSEDLRRMSSSPQVPSKRNGERERGVAEGHVSDERRRPPPESARPRRGDLWQSRLRRCSSLACLQARVAPVRLAFDFAGGLQMVILFWREPLGPIPARHGGRSNRTPPLPHHAACPHRRLDINRLYLM